MGRLVHADVELAPRAAAASTRAGGPSIHLRRRLSLPSSQQPRAAAPPSGGAATRPPESGGGGKASCNRVRSTPHRAGGRASPSALRRRAAANGKLPPRSPCTGWPCRCRPTGLPRLPVRVTLRHARRASSLSQTVRLPRSLRALLYWPQLRRRYWRLRFFFATHRRYQRRRLRSYLCNNAE